MGARGLRCRRHFFMQKIKDYIDRFFKSKKMDINYSLRIPDTIALIDEIHWADTNRLIDAITTLFKYGYVKGYRAAKAEMKKGGVQS